MKCFYVKYWNLNIFEYERFTVYALDKQQIIDNLNKRIPVSYRQTPVVGGDSLSIIEMTDPVSFPIFINMKDSLF